MTNMQRPKLTREHINEMLSNNILIGSDSTGYRFVYNVLADRFYILHSSSHNILGQTRYRANDDEINDLLEMYNNLIGAY